MKKGLKACFFVVLLILCCVTGFAQRQMENLNRGLVAVQSGSGYFLTWRLFGVDPQDTSFGFNVYKNGSKLNSAVITNATCYQDNSGGSGTYTVRPVTNGEEGADSENALLVTGGYINIPLSLPNQPSGANANDCSTGDLDGDGQYEIVLNWQPTNCKDPSQAGVTDNVFLDGYKLNGTRLWRIDLGPNIRAGAHDVQFLVYDFDGDGKAELVTKTAPGTKDGSGSYLSKGPAASDNDGSIYRNSDGYILSGPEYLTVFNGQTGRELATINYKFPAGTVGDWGDTYGNRVSRFNATVAYLDGVHPSIVYNRGYYARTTFWALDWRNGQLTERWSFDTKGGDTSYNGQGCHTIRCGDVDGDGRDEIIAGACAIDDTGRALYNTRLGHGDALHFGDLDPARAGLEVWQVHEDAANNGGIAASYRDARTGAIIWSDPGSSDNGRGCCGPVSANLKGYQFWSGAGGLWDVNHTNVGAKPNSTNFAIWWAGGLNRATEDGTTITAYGGSALLSASGVSSCNGTKSTPCLTADILGDWREEIIYRTTGNDALRVYITTAATTYRLYTLMHDPIYRNSVSSEMSSYNQPPEPGIYIGPQMTLPQAKPNIVLVGTIITPSPTATPTPTPTPTATPTPIPTSNTRGDANGNGKIDISDALVIAQNAAGMNPSPFNSTQADANCDGQVNINDALIVARYCAGMTEVPTCN